MATQNKIEHEGIIQSISSETLEVVINSHSACSGCHAKSACSMAEVKQKIITVTKPAGNFQTGEKVMIYASTGNAASAVVLAYVFPSVLILTAIFILGKTGHSELYAAVASLGVLAIYFLTLYLFRKKIGRHIKFSITKIDHN